MVKQMEEEYWKERGAIVAESFALPNFEVRVEIFVFGLLRWDRDSPLAC